MAGGDRERRSEEGAKPKEDEPDTAGRGMLGASLRDLAESRFQGDDAEANGSSIAFVFEHDGRASCSVRTRTRRRCSRASPS
jgi:hypothetical protein